MDPRLQAKLLRVIQEREIARVGGGTPVKVDVRIIATSNRNLEHEVACQRFRGDLYFRLNVVTLRLPSLVERPKDIPVLAAHFIDKYARANGVPPRRLSAAAEMALLRYAWPGNVRELENAMHRAVVLSTGAEIGADDLLPAPAPAASAPQPDDTAAPRVGQTVAAVERDLIIGTLRHCLGNRTHAATILGISIRTLRNKLKQYAVEGASIPPPPGLGASDDLLASSWSGR
jgi:DNA-binding NtrC family response regulator